MTVRKERDGKPRTTVGWEVAVITDGRKECCCRFCSEMNVCLDEVEVSPVQDGYSFGIKAMSLKSRSWSESSS